MVGDLLGYATGDTEEKAIEKASGQKKAALEAARIRQNQVNAQQYANRMHSLDRVMAMYGPMTQRLAGGRTQPDNPMTSMLPGGSNYASFAEGLPAQKPLSALDLFSSSSPAAVKSGMQADLYTKRLESVPDWAKGFAFAGRR
jgi:hypothetical protein